VETGLDFPFLSRRRSPRANEKLILALIGNMISGGKAGGKAAGGKGKERGKKEKGVVKEPITK